MGKTEMEADVQSVLQAYYVILKAIRLWAETMAILFTTATTVKSLWKERVIIVKATNNW